MEVINMGHTKFLVKVELMWVQNHGHAPLVFMKTSNQYIEYYLYDRCSKHLTSKRCTLSPKVL